MNTQHLFQAAAQGEPGLKSAKWTAMILPVLLLAAAWFCLPLRPVAAQSLIVIVNTEVDPDSLPAATLKEIYEGRKKKWDVNLTVTPVTLKAGATHEDFLRKYINKTPSQFDAYWQRMVYTGKGNRPKALESEADVVSYVKSTSGAVGYIASDTAHDGVKTLRID